jgi:hypothetical protein
MGEAKRRAHATLDGGPESDDKIVLQIEIFDPWALDDAVRHAAALSVIERLEQRPTPICSACEYEFGLKEMPAALYCTRPMFPKGEAYTLISGVICSRCARRPTDELMAAIVGYLRAAKPDMTIVEMGTA